MDAETLHLLCAIVIITLGACVQGILGFGLGLLTMSLLPLFWGIPHAVGTLSPLGVILTLSLTYRLRGHINWSDIKWSLIPMPFGVMLGIGILSHWPNEIIKALLGVLLIAYVLYSLKTPGTQSLEARPLLANTAGFFSGICSGAFGTSGPPILVYANTMNWPRDKFRANLQGFFVTTATLSFVAQVNAGLVNEKTLPKTIAIVPGLLVGAMVGNKLATRIPQALFRRIILVVLTIMGFLYFAISLNRKK